jgi:hypothetical protein
VDGAVPHWAFLAPAISVVISGDFFLGFGCAVDEAVVAVLIPAEVVIDTGLPVTAGANDGAVGADEVGENVGPVLLVHMGAHIRLLKRLAGRGGRTPT